MQLDEQTLTDHALGLGPTGKSSISMVRRSSSISALMDWYDANASSSTPPTDLDQLVASWLDYDSDAAEHDSNTFFISDALAYLQSFGGQRPFYATSPA